MRVFRQCGVALVLVASLTSGHGRAQAHGQPMAITASSPDGLRVWDPAVDRLTRERTLRLRRSDEDSLLPGRSHERLDQHYKGVRVYGGNVARQVEHGLTVSLFGTIYDDIDLDVEPRLTAADAAAAIATLSGVDSARRPQLLILPEETGYRLVYRGTAFSAAGGHDYFIDALNGSLVRREDAVRHQSAVGTGAGVLGDRKKISASSIGGAFVADDALRPPFLVTYDMRGSLQRTLRFLNGTLQLGASDYASDTDNVWTDPAVVDAHAYAGFVYDYYFKRFGRRGLDDNNFNVVSLVHPVARDTFASQPSDVRNQFFANAGYYGDGVMVYGEGLPASVTAAGQHWDFLSGALDVVGHELTHGVTDFTSNLIYRNESGALNEAFSDMMGTAIEFYFQDAGTGPLRADYLIGEDVITPGGLRSLANPSAYGDPDHYRNRYVGTADNGGVHTNSSIGGHAYYLAIEGGTNRTSGLSVRGVGQANREQIEKVVYRAFTQLMPANATYAVARAVTIQAARDLYGAGSPAERAIADAWTAVGVN